MNTCNNEKDNRLEIPYNRGENTIRITFQAPHRMTPGLRAQASRSVTRKQSQAGYSVNKDRFIVWASADSWGSQSPDTTFLIAVFALCSQTPQLNTSLQPMGHINFGFNANTHGSPEFLSYGC